MRNPLAIRNNTFEFSVSWLLIFIAVFINEYIAKEGMDYHSEFRQLKDVFCFFRLGWGMRKEHKEVINYFSS